MVSPYLSFDDLYFPLRLAYFMTTIDSKLIHVLKIAYKLKNL